MTTSAPNDTIAQLRSELFKTLRNLTDQSNPMEIERARAVSDVAQTIINTAKVEIEHLKITGGTGTGFIADTPPTEKGLPKGTTVVAKLPGACVTQHRLRG
jgi:hypothetical protein